MKKELVWDLPIRIFHWAFALSLLGAMGIGLWVDDDSPLFVLHMILGINAVFLLVLRVLLALVGSRHNRFKAFFFSPRETLSYFWGVITGQPNRHFIHNPGTSAAAIGMYLLVPALLISGLAAAADWAEDIHEFMAFSLMVVVGLHLLGIALHSLRHRDGMGSAMITGRKLAPPEAALSSARPLWGTLTLLLIVGWMAALYTNYDATAGTLQIPMVSTPLQLGEESGDKKVDSKKSSEHDKRDKHDDDHDDDD